VEDKKSHNVSETGSVSVFRWMGQDKPTQLGPLERASLNHTAMYAGVLACGTYLYIPVTVQLLIIVQWQRQHKGT
jgi:hypothetical protein